MNNVVMKKYLIAVGLFLNVVDGASSNEAVRPGILEGHLKIFSPKTVDLADASPAALTVETYAEHPLIVLGGDGKKEITRVTADKNGNYRVALPPGDYVLDAHGRSPRRVRAKPQPFRVISNQTVHVDMDIDTGIR